MTVRFLLLSALAACGVASAQGSPTPVFFVNGYQFSCLISNGLSGSFGGFQTLLNAAGIRSGGYDTCSCRGCNIEQHAAAMAKELASFRNADGTVPDQVDIIAHSMGGLIVRAYLAGKTSDNGPPPPAPKIRKIVFAATPNFGLIAPPIDTELTEMQLGSKFLWDLGTWNQNTDDLRGIDAIAIAGSGGSANGRTAPDDGLVPVTSAAISFAADPQRTRVLPYCHSGSIPLIIQCRSDAPPLVKIDSTSNPVFRIVLSFLSGTDEWKTIGDPAPSANGAIDLQYRNAQDIPISLKSATVGGTPLSAGENQVYYREWLPSGTFTAAIDTGTSQLQRQITIPSGGFRPLVWKDGPAIARVYPSAAALPYLAAAPGSLISIYGGTLAVNGSTTVLANNQALQTSYVSAQQVNALLPTGISGLLPLTVRDSAGQHSVNLMIEPVAPALFSLDGSGTGPAAALNALTGQILTSGRTVTAGDFVSLFATGLGETKTSGNLDVATQQPRVLVGGREAVVQFAGRAPGYPGLDQINIQIPAGLPAGDTSVQIISSRRTSNTVTLRIQ